MILARVEGNAISSVAHPSLKGFTLALCQPLDANHEPAGDPFIALDQFSAGLHSIVMVSTDGSAAQSLVHDDSSPARHFIQAIIND